jgi:TRAP-type C4-dicarboxylate transport system substrate-binding protein
MRRLLVVLALLGAARAHADTAVGPKWTLRFASVAPDGSSWARELKAFAKEVSTRSGGQVAIRLLLNAVAGDEKEMGERISKRQIEGVASGGMLCNQIAPSMRVMRLAGVFQDWGESNFVLHELLPVFTDEASKNGYVLLGAGGVGIDAIFSRKPLASWADLRAAKLWRWDLDVVGNMMIKEMGFSPVELPVQDSGKAYDRGKVDGFIGIIGAALAFQWYTRANYMMTDLPTSFLVGCMVISNPAMDPMPAELQQIVRSAGAKLVARIEVVGREMDKTLLNVFPKQGIKVVPVSATLRAAFFEAARAARERLGEKLVPKALLARVLQLLADYHAEHR